MRAHDMGISRTSSLLVIVIALATFIWNSSSRGHAEPPSGRQLSEAPFLVACLENLVAGWFARVGRARCRSSQNAGWQSFESAV